MKMNFNKISFKHSMKNIPIASKKHYKKALVEKVELVIKRMRLKAHLFDSENEVVNQENYGLKTRSCPPQHKDLIKFEEDMISLMKIIRFKNVNNSFHKA